MAADDSRRLVIDLSVITEESVIENTLVDNCPKGGTEGVMEEMDEMDVGNGVTDTDTDGFQTVLRRKRRGSPELIRTLSDSAKKVRVEQMRSIDRVVYMKGSSENLACPKRARNIRDAIVKAFGLVERIQVAGESLRIFCRTEAQKAAFLNSKTLETLGNVIHIVCTLPFCRTEERLKTQLGNKAVISGLDILMTEDEILTELQEARVDEERKILDSQIGVLHERLKVQATEHELLLQKLQQAKKDLNVDRRLGETEMNSPSLSSTSLVLIPIPVLVMACNRLTVKRTVDQLLKYRSSAEQFPIIVSQDCGHNPTADVIRSYEDKVIHIQHPDLSDIELPKQELKFKGYHMIARHYKWALNQIFHRFNSTAAIIVEDDLDLSPDFFEYFLATYKILHSDPTLWCVSAWNDNGKTGMISDDPELLYRTDFFPGLGWMLEKKIWLEMENKWPKTFWDDWMRHPDQRRDRTCIRPEISRTSTFGRQGVSKGQHFDKHLKFIQHNTKFVPFTKMDLSYLIQENYDEPFVRMVYGSPLMTTVQLLAGDQQTVDPVRVQYRDKESFKSQAKLLGIMDDLKSGVPRTGYRGIVSFMFRGRRVYFAPPGDWTGYDVSWN